MLKSILMKERNIIDLGLLIPLLTILAFSATYYHELGYFTYFGLPKDLIEIELSQKSYLVFAFIITFIIYSIAIQPLYSGVIALFDFKSKVWIPKLIMVIILLVIIYFAYWDAMLLIYHKEIISPITGLFLGVVFLILKKKKIEDIHEDDWSLMKYINYSLGNSLGPILIISAITCIIMFNKGIADAATKLITLKKVDKRTVLIRKYSDYSLYGIPDSITSKLRSVIIERSSTDIDTLYITTNEIVISIKK